VHVTYKYRLTWPGLVKGSSIAFSAVKNEKLLRAFLDAIGSDDAHQLVHVQDAKGKTMLHAAVMMNKLESVKILLDYGADPSARDIAGQTPLLALKWDLSWMGTFHLLPLLVQALRSLATKKPFDEDQALAIQNLLEERGSREQDMVDDIYGRNEIENMMSDFSSEPRIGEFIVELINNYESSPFRAYLDTDSPFLRRLSSIENDDVLRELGQALLVWADKRKRKLIPQDELPDGWSDFFEDFNRRTNGSLTEKMQDDQIPEITKIFKDLAVSVCEWAVSNEVPEILEHITILLHESIRTGAFAEILTHGIAAAAIVSGLVQHPERFSFLTKLLLCQRLRRIWKAIKKGEQLDLLHKVVAKHGMGDTFDHLSEFLVLDGLRPGPNPPASLLEALSLPKRYPGSAVFVTSTRQCAMYIRHSLAIIQFIVFLCPPAFMLVVLYFQFQFIICYNTIRVCLAFHFLSNIPNTWAICDENFRLHPNISRGARAAWELLRFRLRHGCPAQEPLIISFRADDQRHVDMPARMESMQKMALYPIYWLSLRRDDVAVPVPCYSAMRILMTSWKRGRLPRKAWGDQGRG
jgi:hypothetical protein